jgi:hypothetical protein
MFDAHAVNFTRGALDQAQVVFAVRCRAMPSLLML